jgi:hypothetical protein
MQLFTSFLKQIIITVSGFQQLVLKLLGQKIVVAARIGHLQGTHPI